jgi:hypothetical protein
LPTDNEQLGTSIPLFASQLANTVTELFPELDVQSKSRQQSNVPMESKAESQTEPSRKPSPVASLPKSSLSQEEDRELAEDIFGDEDSKPLAKVNPYNSAARISPNISQDRHGNFIQEQQKEEIQKAV